MVSGSEKDPGSPTSRNDNDDDLLPDREVALEFYIRYEPFEVLGRGLSSVVRRCIHRESGQAYAVKIIDISNDQDHVDEEGMSELQQIHREISILRAVQGHPYIVELGETFETPTHIFLVFELCKRGELYEYLDEKVRLSEKSVRRYMHQLLEAVSYCHTLGFVHRDLKPENILLSDDYNSIKLTDFGLAKSLDKKGGERLYQVCGTPGYLAPEVLRSGMYEPEHPLCTGYSFEVDAWACGIIAYTLLVGRPPFWHRNQLKMIRQICDSSHSYIGPEWSEVSDETKDLIDRLLSKDFEQRMTINEAMKHDMFKRFGSSKDSSRKTSRTTSIIGIDNINDDTIVSIAQVQNRRQSLWNNNPEAIAKNLGLNEENVDKIAVQRGDSSCTKMECLESLPKFISSPPPPSPMEPDLEKFDGLKTFRTLVHCVRFIFRLSRIREIPELLPLSKARKRPYEMRPLRKTIDTWTFTLYSHWVKKGEGMGQNRAALFQHNPRVSERSSSVDVVNTNTLLLPNDPRQLFTV